MFMGFILHIYIIFGTNLLTAGPTHIAVFFSYFSISKKRNIKRSPNGMKPSGELFLEQKQSRRLGVHTRESTRRARGRGARLPPGRALLPHGCLVASLTSTPNLMVCFRSKKDHREGFIPFGLRLVFLFLETLK